MLSHGTNQARPRIATGPPAGARERPAGGPSCLRRLIRLSRASCSDAVSELEAKGTEFHAGTSPLFAMKKPANGTNQPGHWRPPSGRAAGAARRPRQRCDAQHKKSLFKSLFRNVAASCCRHSVGAPRPAEWLANGSIFLYGEVVMGSGAYSVFIDHETPGGGPPGSL